MKIALRTRRKAALKANMVLRPERIPKEGGASRSESYLTIAGGNRSMKSPALPTAPPLSRILSFFLGGTRKKPPEGPSPNADGVQLK